MYPFDRLRLPVLILALAAVACRTSSVAPPSATPTTTSSAPASPFLPPPTVGLDGPSPSPSAAATLQVGGFAGVVVRRLKQVVDPFDPQNDAFSSPQNVGERGLLPLVGDDLVYLVDGPVVTTNSTFWKVADPSYFGCCAPFGWVRTVNVAGEVALEPVEPECPEPAEVQPSTLAELDGRLRVACFGDNELSLSGSISCSALVRDGPVFLDGPTWARDRIDCVVDSVLAVYGEAVTSLGEGPGIDGFTGFVQLRGHFDDASASECHWAPGSYGVFPMDDPPAETAQFACRTLFVVSTATAFE